MKKHLILLSFTAILMFTTIHLAAQVAINSDASAPDNSAMLDIKSTTKGMLVPRMTTVQRNAISSPAKGLMIFCTDNNAYYSNAGTPASPLWVMMSSQWLNTGTDIFYNLGKVGIGTSAPSKPLEVSGTGGIKITNGSFASSNNELFFSDNGQIRSLDDYHRIVFNRSSDQLEFNELGRILFKTGNPLTEVMRVTGDGKVAIGTVSPASSAVVDISSTSKGFLTPRMTTPQINAIANPAEGMSVYNLSIHFPVFFDGTCWKRTDGQLYIGEGYGGGVIAYFLKPGDAGYDPNVLHGLIAAPADTWSAWGCVGVDITGASGASIGTGNQNTIDIMLGCAEEGIAAKVCGNLVLGGYSDWYLPSILELYQLYLNKDAIGGFVDGDYWSSTEYSPTDARVLPFYDGGLNWVLNKVSGGDVRAIRAF